MNGGVKFGMGKNAGKVSSLLFADDTTLMAESENNLQRYVSAFVRVCERRKLKISPGIVYMYTHTILSSIRGVSK